jgi:hypothetical protein
MRSYEVAQVPTSLGLIGVEDVLSSGGSEER